MRARKDPWRQKVVPEPRGNKASRKWNRESAKEGARISVCPREYVWERADECME